MFRYSVEQIILPEESSSISVCDFLDLIIGSYKCFMPRRGKLPSHTRLGGTANACSLSCTQGFKTAWTVVLLGISVLPAQAPPLEACHGGLAQAVLPRLSYWGRGNLNSLFPTLTQ